MRINLPETAAKSDCCYCDISPKRSTNYYCNKKNVSHRKNKIKGKIEKFYNKMQKLSLKSLNSLILMGETIIHYTRRK